MCFHLLWTQNTFLRFSVQHFRVFIIQKIVTFAFQDHIYSSLTRIINLDKKYSIRVFVGFYFFGKESKTWRLNTRLPLESLFTREQAEWLMAYKDGFLWPWHLPGFFNAHCVLRLGKRLVPIRRSGWVKWVSRAQKWASNCVFSCSQLYFRFS